MILCKVVGTVVATQKDKGLEGFKLQVVQTLDIQTLKPGKPFPGCRRRRRRRYQ